MAAAENFVWRLQFALIISKCDLIEICVSCLKL